MERNHIENHDDSISISSSIFSMDFTLTKGRLDAINGGFTDKTEYISNGTREKLKLAETKLAAKQIATSSRTREKLALAEAELACKRNETSSKTRERLEEVEKQLALDHCCTSTRTREQLEFAEELLCRLNLMSENSAGSGNENEHQRKSKLFMKKQELLRRMLKVNANVDVAFLVDCTGSMDTYIQETKIDIQGIMTNIMDRFENRIRVAFVGYRDHGDGPLRIECLGFTENVEKFKRFVSNVPATGGNDAPEDVFGGLEAAINLTWSSRNKVIFHIADAPQHGFRFHNYSDSEDDYYGIEPRGLQVEDLLKSIKQMNIKYYFGKINDSTDKMINEFQRVGGAKVVEIIDMKNPDLLGMVVVESIATTIDYTLCKSMRRLKSIRDVGDNCLLTGTSGESGSRKTLKCFSISDVEPDYSCVKTEDEIKWLECNIPTLPTLNDIKNHIGVINHKWTTATVKIAADPFSQGEQRISYHGIKVLNPSSQNIVLKEFKHVGKGRDRREDYIEIMETQAVAAFMANEFNKVAPMGSKGIKFLHVSVIQIYKVDGSPKYYNVEVLLPDYKENFKKWNSNAGYVSDKIYSASLDAFSHWTYDITDGFLVVVDLQGVFREKQYILTDPSINCIEPRFGLTNLGDIGIKMFFRSHSCGDVCQAMGLKKNKYMRYSTPARLSAAFTKMVGWA